MSFSMAVSVFRIKLFPRHDLGSWFWDILVSYQFRRSEYICVLDMILTLIIGSCPLPLILITILIGICWCPYSSNSDFIWWSIHKHTAPVRKANKTSLRHSQSIKHMCCRIGERGRNNTKYINVPHIFRRQILHAYIYIYTCGLNAVHIRTRTSKMPSTVFLIVSSFLFNPTYKIIYSFMSTHTNFEIYTHTISYLCVLSQGWGNIRSSAPFVALCKEVSPSSQTRKASAREADGTAFFLMEKKIHRSSGWPVLDGWKLIATVTVILWDVYQLMQVFFVIASNCHKILLGM